MIISFMNQKGGVGKTSVTLAVALTLEKAGERVGIIDMDSQKTSTRFLYYLRANNQTNIEITTSSKGFDYVLIDTAPSLSMNHVKAADISDRVIMVTKTAPPNLLSTQETIEYLRKHCRADLPLFLLFNHVDTRDGNTPNLKEKAVKVGGHHCRTTCLICRTMSISSCKAMRHLAMRRDWSCRKWFMISFLHLPPRIRSEGS